MISPPVTVWPANTLTPRRWRLSRAVAAMSRGPSYAPSVASAVQRPWPCSCATLRPADLVDLDPGQLLTVTVAALVAALWLELDDAELGAALVGDDRRLHAAPWRGLAVEDLVAVDVAAAASATTVSPSSSGSRSTSRRLPLLDAVLLAACLDDRVHVSSSDVRACSRSRLGLGTGTAPSASAAAAPRLRFYVIAARRSRVSEPRRAAPGRRSSDGDRRGRARPPRSAPAASRRRAGRRRVTEMM